MKIEIMGYEVEVKAKDKITSEKFNKADTEYFLNDMVLVLHAAATFYQGQGIEVWHKKYSKASDDLFQALKEAGTYDK